MTFFEHQNSAAFLSDAFKKDLGVPEVKHFEILGFKNLGKKVS